MTIDRQPRTEIVGTKLTKEELVELDAEISRQGFKTRSAGVRAFILGAVAAVKRIRKDAA